MAELDDVHGPPDTYEIQWVSGHVEQVQAHQVILPLLDMETGQVQRRVVTIHGEFDGRWKLVLHAPEEDIRSIRLITDPEPIPRA